MGKEIYKNLSEALLRAGSLEGVKPYHDEDSVCIQAGHLDDYLLVVYLGQLIERGDMEVKIVPDRIGYLMKLLHMENNND